MPAVLNAANEVAVSAFLGRRLNFASIAAVIDCVLQQHEAGPVRSLEDALAADAWAREHALARARPPAGGRRMSPTILTSIVAFVVAIGVLVTVHEFGHFWVARRLGFKVLRFSIGFGKPLVRRVSRDADAVEYVLAAIPLGGYVRLLDERDGPVPPARSASRASTAGRRLRASRCCSRVRPQTSCSRSSPYWILLMQGIPGPQAGDRRGVARFLRGAARTCARSTRSRAVAGKATPTRQAAVLAILEGVVDEGAVPVEVRGEGRGPRASSRSACPRASGAR